MKTLWETGDYDICLSLNTLTKKKLQTKTEL
jgi:hypothetical protein